MASNSSGLRSTARVLLGLGLVGFGVVHLTVGRKPFRAQVPKKLVKNVPVSTDEVVVGSGLVEIGLGTALAALPNEHRRVGTATAAYFVAIFPATFRSC